MAQRRKRTRFLGSNDEPTDEELLRACACFDVDALHDLYRRHGKAVYDTAVVAARSRRCSPDDLVVDAFAGLWRDLTGGTAVAGSVLRHLLVRVARADVVVGVPTTV